MSVCMYVHIHTSHIDRSVLIQPTLELLCDGAGMYLSTFMSVFVFAYMPVCVQSVCFCMCVCVCIYIYIYVCMYVCMCIYIYIYIYYVMGVFHF